MSPATLRPYGPKDLDAIKLLTIEAFDGVTIEQDIEDVLGILHGRDWRWRKARHIDADAAANPAGIFVAEALGCVVGYVTTRLDREAGQGRIVNLAVGLDFREHGLGRRLIEHALEYFRREGLEYAMIETMDQNETGQHLYPACGFVEVSRQVHYARKL